MRILIDSLSKSFSDVLVGYSLVPVIRQKYPHAEITLACSPMDTRLFRKSKCLDNVVLQTAYHCKNNWCQYEQIYQGNFTLDSQWNPEKSFGALDTPEMWVQNNTGLGFEFLKSDRKLFDNMFGKHLPENKKLVGISYTIPAADDPHYQVTHVSPKKWQQIIKQLNQVRDDVCFVLFGASPERTNLNIDEPNIINLGAIDKIATALLFERMDVLLSSMSSIFAYSNFFDVNRIALTSIGADGKYMWSGVPDECAIPHCRVLALTKDLRGDSQTMFMYPEEYATQIDWKCFDFVALEERQRKMLSLEEIDEKQVALTASNMIDGGIEQQLSDVCDSCELHKDKKCLYWWKNE